MVMAMMRKFFDFCGIPSCSIQNTNFKEYHSSFDNIKLLDFKKINKVKNLLVDYILELDSDPIYQFTNDVLFYQSKYNLYADAINDANNFKRNRLIFNSIKNINLSEIVKIASISLKILLKLS